jgi:hypothetical protein
MWQKIKCLFGYHAGDVLVCNHKSRPFLEEVRCGFCHRLITIRRKYVSGRGRIK